MSTITANPGDNLQAAFAKCNNNDTLLLADGAYIGQTIDTSGKSGVTIQAANVVPVTAAVGYATPVHDPLTARGGSVILSGKGKQTAITGFGQAITVRGITVDQYENPEGVGALIVGGSGWLLENVIVQLCFTQGVGVRAGCKGVNFKRLAAQANGREGYGGGGNNAGDQPQITMTDSWFLWNNRGWPTNVFGSDGVNVNGLWYANPDNEAGGGKYGNSGGVQIIRCWSEANDGPGFWFDYDNHAYLIQDSASIRNTNSVRGYEGAGIESEISDTGPNVIDHCLVDSILPAEDHKLTVKNSHILAGINFRNLGGPTGLRNGGCQDITITGNYFYGGAKINFWAGMDAAYCAANRIITSPNTMGVTGAPNWVGGPLGAGTGPVDPPPPPPVKPPTVQSLIFNPDFTIGGKWSQ